MSEPKLISPLLDGFHMGAPISDHDGVQCCPAMKENSDNKYIVKIISIPASQVQLDALLLTGAYKDPGAAMDYFKELTDGVVEEAKILKKLSKLEGFLPYDNWQVEPANENQLGYQIYLISSYKRSLEKFLRKNTMTHKGAVNLGLDICSALAIARRAGYLYADLKPTNIFLSDDHQHRIGDLGFLEIASLKYTSLPSKYVSDYTAPELKDAFTTVNMTVDTYALGMILYQLYNNGQLPVIAEEEPLPAPLNADYELAEIILKACAWNPEDRYTDPADMGRDLYAYLQRNHIDDTPITPPPAEITEEAVPMAQVDETVPEAADAEDVMPENITEETAAMVEQADELASHEIPAHAEISEPEAAAEEAPAEAVESPAEATEPPAEPEAPQQETPVTETKETKEKKPKKAKKKKKKGSGLKAVLVLMVLALALGGGFIFYNEYYMQTIQSITVDGERNDLTVTLDTEIDNSLLTVTIADAYGNAQHSEVANNQAHFEGLLADSLYKIQVDISGFHSLKGVSTQSYTTPAETGIASLTAKTGAEDGSVVLSFAVSGPEAESWIVTATAEGEDSITQNFTSHTVTLTGLTVGKDYVLTLEPSNDLFLVGETTVAFTASPVIQARDLKVANYGDGVMTVTWTVPEDVTVDSWTARCYTASGEEQVQTVTEPSVTFTNLDTNLEYTIEVLAAGMTEPSRTSISANPTILRNIQIDDQDASKLVISWEFMGVQPENGWHVKYSVDGCTPLGIVEASETSAVIQPRIPGAAYEFTIVPAGGGSAFENVISYECPNAAIFSYDKAKITADNISKNMRVNLLKRPEKENWTYKDVTTQDYTQDFTSGDQASMLLFLNQNFYTYPMDVNVMFVIRNADKHVRNDLVAQTVMDWNEMWNGGNYHYCELDIPKFPTEAGEYSLYIYFNNQAITVIDFTVTE